MSRRPVSDSDTGSGNRDRPPHNYLCTRRRPQQSQPPHRSIASAVGMSRRRASLISVGEKPCGAGSRTAAGPTSSTMSHRVRLQCRHAVVRLKSRDGSCIGASVDPGPSPHVRRYSQGVRHRRWILLPRVSATPARQPDPSRTHQRNENLFSKHALPHSPISLTRNQKRLRS